jgi:hypothetical protein
MATKQLTLSIGEVPDALPAVEFLDGDSTAQIAYAGVPGRYVVRITGEGVINFLLSYAVSTVARQKLFTLSFVPSAIAVDVPAIVAGVDGSATGVNAATAATQATLAATEIGKVPRAAVAMNGGDDFAWNAEVDTADKLTLNITSES